MPVFQQTRHMLGSECLITLVVASADRAGELFDELWFRVEAFEQRFSRFKPDSELTQFNNNAGKQTPVTGSFMRMLETVVQLGVQTGNLYNPFILPALQTAGYRGSWPQPNRAEQGTDFHDREFAQVDHIILGDGWAMTPPHTALDFGGCGKGYILDKTAAYLDNQGVENYWLSFGGDIICKGAEPGQTAWSIAIQDAFDPTAFVGKFSNTGGDHMAVATSGTAKRRGEGWHHIIDPRTNKPAVTDIVTASVQTSSALTADVLAKCLVILGSTKAQKFATEQGLEQVILQLESHNIITWGTL